MERHQGGFRRARTKDRWVRALVRTPTYWVIALLILATSTLIAEAFSWSSSTKARKAELKTKVWPAERASTIALLKAQQAAKPAATQEQIDLSTYLNTGLSDSIGKYENNNLAELPSGIHTFGGVSFKIDGVIRLAGQPPVAGEKRLPARVRIPVSGKWARLHLLHGASNLRTLQTKIARLVLRYADGSKAEFEIVGGERVLNWWGPIYNTDSGDGRYTASPDTELAWAGSNPAITKHSPDFSLRLYRTTFTNPHPELAIKNLDYISMVEGAAPFVVGLTVEQSTSPSNLK